jgi:hypothetical protein
VEELRPSSLPRIGVSDNSLFPPRQCVCVRESKVECFSLSRHHTGRRAREAHWEPAKAPMFPQAVWGSLCWELATAPRRDPATAPNWPPHTAMQKLRIVILRFGTVRQ